MTATAPKQAEDFRIVTRERMRGTVNRWRRFGEPVAAGDSLHEDGTPDYGIFGPDSVVWEVLLHPATSVFQFPFQALLQRTYKPILAGIRDHDPLTRNARKDRMTAFDIFERGQRNSGMHAPMWLGDTPTAEKMAKHLHNIHTKVAGDVIDVGNPALGGYAAASPRETMWAALTEMHSMLWMYETCAFRDGRRPHRLPPEKRDRFVAEVAAYCRLVGAAEEDIPTTMAELAALYERDAALFGLTRTLMDFPDGSGDMATLSGEQVKKHFHRSQLPAIFYALILDHGLLNKIAMGAVSGPTRRSMGLDAEASRKAVRRTKALLPLIWLLQRRVFERHYLRLMWGPDGQRLIDSARALRARQRD